jgi:hypothetical protein
MKTVFDVYNDPGHGWLKVPFKDIVDLGLVNNISSFSYTRGDYVYLEEDRDASLFLEKLAEVNKVDIKTFMFREHHTNRSSKIRSYDSYKEKWR